MEVTSVNRMKGTRIFELHFNLIYALFANPPICVDMGLGLASLNPSDRTLLS